MNYTIYNTATGQIIQQISATDPSNLDFGTNGVIEGLYDQKQYYIDNGTPTLLPTKPQGKNIYTFNWSTKTWDVDLAKTEIAARDYRNGLLRENIDTYNPIRYGELTVDQQQELAAYRTALLNVPQQSGWPTTIEWPTKPSWL